MVKGRLAAQADATPASDALRGLEPSNHIGEISWHLSVGITLEVIREGQGKRRGSWSNGIALGLSRRSRHGVHMFRFKIERKLSLHGMNVGLFHKPVRWIGGTEIGRPKMQRILVKPRELEVLRLRAFCLDGFHDQAEVRVLRRLQRHITSMRARGVSAEESRCAVDVTPAGLRELGGMRHHPE